MKLNGDIIDAAAAAIHAPFSCLYDHQSILHMVIAVDVDDSDDDGGDGDGDGDGDDNDDELADRLNERLLRMCIFVYEQR